MVHLRKSVYEFFMQMEEKELMTSLSMENSHSIVEMLFNSLVDEENSIKKAGL
jgi:hypothetical protein